MYVCMYVCMYVFLYVCIMYVYMSGIYVGVYSVCPVCMHLCLQKHNPLCHHTNPFPSFLGSQWRNSLSTFLSNARWSYGMGVALKLGLARVEINYCIPHRAMSSDRQDTKSAITKSYMIC